MPYKPVKHTKRLNIIIDLTYSKALNALAKSYGTTLPKIVMRLFDEICQVDIGVDKPKIIIDFEKQVAIAKENQQNALDKIKGI